MQLLFALLSCSLLPAWPSRAQPPTVRQIEFEGVDAVSAQELRSHMLTRRPDRLRFWKPAPEWSQGALEEDMARIERVYRDHGYYDAEASYTLRWDESQDRVSIAIQVEEGEPVRLVTDVAIELPPGAPTSPSALAEDLPLRRGEVFTVSNYRDARAQVLLRLADLAHPAATIEGGADVDVTTREVRVRWQVQPGPPIRFGEVRVSGLERVQEHVVRRELEVVAGEPYSATAIDRTRRRLARLQLFRYVSVEPDRSETPPSVGGEDVWPLTVELNERAHRSISLGAGWASGIGPRGSARWAHRNFLGDGRRLQLSAAASPIEQVANVRLLQPHILRTRATLELDSGWRRRDRSSYTSNAVNFTLGPRRSFGQWWVGEVAYRFGWTGLSDVRDRSQEVLREQKNVGFLSGLGVRARRAQLDTLEKTTRGTWLQLGLGTNLRGLGSDFDWMRYSVELRGYLPLGPTVLAARVQARAIDPFGSTQPGEVPLDERLFLGGPHMGRGFPYEKLGPLDAAGDPLGGLTSLLASVEWRVPVWGPVGAVGFVDAGQVSLSPFNLSADQFGVGVGAGLTLETPVGPVAGYVGYPVRHLEVSQEPRFAITVGHSF
jgi:outer membrane protein insertion porin family/translocation and assembly module TamA